MDSSVPRETVTGGTDPGAAATTAARDTRVDHWVGESHRPRLSWSVRAALLLGAVLAAVWAAQFFLNLYLWAIRGTPNSDWDNLSSLQASMPYAIAAFRWAPIAAWAWVGLVIPLGLALWRLLHFAALILIGDWRVILIVLATFPFWWDVAHGNIMTFVFVSAWHAIAGRRSGVIVFCVLAAIAPRPLMLPVLGWLLWHRQDARWSFGAAVLAVIITALASGQLEPWIVRLVGSSSELADQWNLGPSLLIGAAWIPIGLVLGALAARRGYLGLSSVLIQPYLFHYYLLMVALDLRHFTGSSRTGMTAGTDRAVQPDRLEPARVPATPPDRH